jgi:hypothetical protein
MIQPDIDITGPTEEKRPQTIVDLLLYLLAGFGLFVLFSGLLAQVSEVGTLLDSGLRYLINLFFLGGTTLLLGVYRRKITWQQLGL